MKTISITRPTFGNSAPRATLAERQGDVEGSATTTMRAPATLGPTPGWHRSCHHGLSGRAVIRMVSGRRWASRDGSGNQLHAQLPASSGAMSACAFNSQALNVQASQDDRLQHLQIFLLPVPQRTSTTEALTEHRPRLCCGITPSIVRGGRSSISAVAVTTQTSGEVSSGARHESRHHRASAAFFSLFISSSWASGQPGSLPDAHAVGLRPERFSNQESIFGAIPIKDHHPSGCRFRRRG